MTKIFAHRGASYHCPENTMSSFKKAEQLGADGIEFDVQLSADGVPVVIHDRTLRRTTNGYGNVDSMTVNELQRLDAGSWFAQDYKHESIPTLQEVLNWSKQTDLLLNIELKSRGKESDLEKNVVASIMKHELANRVIISSFWKSSLKQIKLLNADLLTAILLEKSVDDSLAFAQKLNLEAIHPNYKHVTKEYIDFIHSHNLKIRPYTVNNDRKMRRLVQWNVDAIITDRPDIAVWQKKKRNEN